MNETKYKSSVFSLLLSITEYALDVYNVLNDSHYEDPEVVEILAFENGVLLSVRNDASFIVDFCLNIYEHQSTYNPNMPLRFLINIPRPCGAGPCRQCNQKNAVKAILTQFM